MNILSKVVVTTGTALAMTACGGGGGGGSNGSGDGSVQITPSAKITASNAPTIAGAVVQATSQSDVFNALGGLTMPAIAATGQVASAAVTAMKPVTVAAATGSEVLECAVSGSVSYSATIASPDTLTAGDQIRFTFSNCDQGEGAVIDGGFDFTVRAFDGDVAAESFLLTVDLAASRFEVRDAADTASIDGDLSLTLDTRDAGATRVELSGDSLEVTANTRIASLADFSTVMVVDPLLETSTLDMDGYLMASTFNGEVRYQTNETLLLDTAGQATAGQIQITGAQDGTVLVTVHGQQQVQLDIDPDGDGVIDHVVMVTWEELRT